MSAETEKLVAVLTRCGPFARVGAQSLIKELKADEAQQLAALADQLEQLDRFRPPDDKAQRAAAVEKAGAELKQVGADFRQLMDSVANRTVANRVAENQRAKRQAEKPPAPVVGTGEP